LSDLDQEGLNAAPLSGDACSVALAKCDHSVRYRVDKDRRGRLISDCRQQRQANYKASHS
jgi:hypothetical protein